MPNEVPISNADLFLWSLSTLGGDRDFVDVEDVYIEAFRLAPDKLSWRTKPDLPDLKKCAKGLQEAEAREPKLLLKRGHYKRMLSADGRGWLAENRSRLREALGGAEPYLGQSPRSHVSRLVKQMRSSSEYGIWKSEGVIGRKRWQIAQLLNCSLDSDSELVRNRLGELKAAANQVGDDQLISFVNQLQIVSEEVFSE